jgi:hypothetical protein
MPALWRSYASRSGRAAPRQTGIFQTSLAGARRAPGIPGRRPRGACSAASIKDRRMPNRPSTASAPTPPSPNESLLLVAVPVPPPVDRRSRHDQAGEDRDCEVEHLEQRHVLRREDAHEDRYTEPDEAPDDGDVPSEIDQRRALRRRSALELTRLRLRRIRRILRTLTFDTPPLHRPSEVLVRHRPAPSRAVVTIRPPYTGAPAPCFLEERQAINWMADRLGQGRVFV